MATAAPSKSASTATGRFIKRVAEATGLDQLVLSTWVIAEHSVTTNNPLNIMDPATKKPVAFATPEAAADATIRTLRKPMYAPVLRAAATGQPKAQLDAIAASAWDRGNYRGNDASGKPIASNKPGALLYGVWTTLVGGPPIAGSTHSYAADPFSVGGVAGGVIGAAGAVGVGGLGTDPQGNDPGSGIERAFASAEDWAGGAALTALAYVLLTVAALVLVLLGVSRIAGVSAGIGPLTVGFPGTRRVPVGGGGGGPGEVIPF